MRVLDLACGGGDITARVLPRISPGGSVVLADANAEMLALARRRFANDAVRFFRCDAESLPFADYAFDRVFVAFGLRNFTRRDKALREMHRVLRPGGMSIVLEFTPPEGIFAPLQNAICFRYCREWAMFFRGCGKLSLFGRIDFAFPSAARCRK